MMDKLFYNLGYALGQAEALVERGADLDDGGAEEDVDLPVDDPPRRSRAASAASAVRDAFGDPAAGLALGASAATWALGRVLHPRPVHWPRAVLAGAAGTALADLAERALRREDARSAHFLPRLEDLPRYAAGVATAAAYAAVAYPLLPGSPLVRALLFGALDAATREAGGAVGLLQRVAPRLPLEALSSLEAPRRAPASALAFALGLALYRGKGRR
jgi:hypothetical protein